jgi:Na+/H+-dicarboxylate symporter
MNSGETALVHRGVVGRTRSGVPLHVQILAGMVVGGVAGLAANALWSGSPGLDWAVSVVAQPMGQIFLRLLFMVVIPLVFTSLALGVSALGDVGRLGRVGLRTLGLFLGTTTVAAAIGLALANLVQPGALMDEATRASLLAQFSGEAGQRLEGGGGFGVQMLVAMVPRNPVEAAARGDMLAVIVFTLVFALALTRVGPSAAPVLAVLEGVGRAVMEMIGLVMKVAPVGVAALLFAVTARFGFDLLGSLGLYVATVLAGLMIHQLVIIPTVALVLAGVTPATLFRRARVLMLTAFSTSSSSATLPTTIRTAEEGFGVPRSVAGFVLPLGATLNMNGTALFEGMTVLFLAQVFGVELSLGMQVIVVIMTVVTAVGAAGVPGGSIPLLAMILVMVGVPAEGIAIILGVDRLLDMARTVPNVTGDLVTALAVARMERAAGDASDLSAQAGPALDLVARAAAGSDAP